MKNRTTNLKWIAGISAVLVVLLSVPVVQGGVRWSGIDPEIRVKGETFNVFIEWPEDSTCLIDGVIDVDIWYPKGSNAKLISESESYTDFPCDESGNSSLINNGFITVLTKTSLKDGTKSDPNRGGILVSAKVNTSEKMPVRVKVYHKGQLVQSCEDISDDFVFCDPYLFDGEGEGASGEQGEDDNEDDDDDN